MLLVGLQNATQHVVKQSSSFLLSEIHKLPCYPAIPGLEIYLREVKIL